MSKKICKFKECDWVSFSRDGQLIIGQIVAVRKTYDRPPHWKLITTVGSVDDSDVLEVRQRHVLDATDEAGIPEIPTT